MRRRRQGLVDPDQLVSKLSDLYAQVAEAEDDKTTADNVGTKVENVKVQQPCAESELSHSSWG